MTKQLESEYGKLILDLNSTLIKREKLDRLNQEERELRNHAAKEKVQHQNFYVIQQQLQKTNEQVWNSEANIQEITQRSMALQQTVKDNVAKLNEHSNVISSLEQRKANLEQQAHQNELLLQRIKGILSNFKHVDKTPLSAGIIMSEILSSEDLAKTTVLQDTIKRNHITEFTQILQKIKNIDWQDSDSKTPLMNTILNVFYKGVDALLQKAPNVNIVDKGGCNALIYCAHAPHMKYFKQLAEKTMHINHQSYELAGNSALHILVANTRNILFPDELAPYINTNGDVYLDSLNYINLGDKLCFNSKSGGTFVVGGLFRNWTISDEGYNTQQDKTLKIMKWLVELGADINMQNSQGLTPFFLACAHHLKYLAHQIVDDFHINYELTDINKYGALFWALELKDIKILQKILDKGVDINAQDGNGFTCLYWTAIYNHEDIAIWLIQHGSDLNLPNNMGGTPLHQAITNQYLPMVKIIVEHGANINKASKDDASPLYHSLGSCSQLGVDITKYLVDHGANVDQPMNDGDTPMHMVAYHCNLKAGKILLSHGANINTKNRDGKTPLLTAIEHKSSDQTARLKTIQNFLANNADPSIYDNQNHDAKWYAEHYLNEAVYWIDHPKEIDVALIG